MLDLGAVHMDTGIWTSFHPMFSKKFIQCPFRMSYRYEESCFWLLSTVRGSSREVVVLLSICSWTLEELYWHQWISACFRLQYGRCSEFEGSFLDNEENILHSKSKDRSTALH